MEIFKAMTLFLGLVCIILVGQMIYERNQIKIFDINGIEVTQQELCEFYKLYGNKGFDLCDIEDKHCIKIRLNKNPCIETGYGGKNE